MNENWMNGKIKIGIYQSEMLNNCGRLGPV